MATGIDISSIPFQPRSDPSRDALVLSEEQLRSMVDAMLQQQRVSINMLADALGIMAGFDLDQHMRENLKMLYILTGSLRDKIALVHGEDHTGLIIANPESRR